MWKTIKKILNESRPLEVRKKISQAMKGKSNFEGHRHTASAKSKIRQERGHDDQGKVGGSTWVRTTAYTSKKPDRRIKGSNIPKGYEKGR